MLQILLRIEAFLKHDNAWISDCILLFKIPGCQADQLC